MQLQDLRTFLGKLPHDFDEFELVNGEVSKLDGTEVTFRVDKPIISMLVDEDTKEICFLHQTQEDVTIINGNK